MSSSPPSLMSTPLAQLPLALMRTLPSMQCCMVLLLLLSLLLLQLCRQGALGT